MEKDLALVRRCLDGDEQAWHRLVSAHRQTMIELARRIVPHAAEEVVDGVIADIWRRGKLARYEGRSALGTWLGAIAINAALNARRSATARPEVAVDASGVPDPPAPSTDVATDRSRVADLLHEAIAMLPPPGKLLILWYYEQQLTLDEIAALDGRSKSTLSRSLAQAREAIRRQAEQLAQDRYGVALAALRSDVDLGALELDLRQACAADPDHRDHRDTRGGPVSNS